MFRFRCCVHRTSSAAQLGSAANRIPLISTPALCASCLQSRIVRAAICAANASDDPGHPAKLSPKALADLRKWDWVSPVVVRARFLIAFNGG